MQLFSLSYSVIGDRNTPQFRLNAEIGRTVKPYWENIAGGIAYLKEALRIRIGIESPKAVFIAACKEGWKPESAQVKAQTRNKSILRIKTNNRLPPLKTTKAGDLFLWISLNLLSRIGLIGRGNKGL
ncbi:hypothetical protein H6H03_38780 [Nostoc paludosum FACHB-159]|uniref:Uncharacterized protein n=1 Tax=Nostoc paludosum FACHB-159 TaxID=2692908 RepID=A0ABR8KM87_9NOSO|nr:hypothetical protein [Nostoc paludosum FACHB-159]